jgi:hypothetical protein
MTRQRLPYRGEKRSEILRLRVTRGEAALLAAWASAAGKSKSEAVRDWIVGRLLSEVEAAARVLSPEELARMQEEIERRTQHAERQQEPKAEASA